MKRNTKVGSNMEARVSMAEYKMYLKQIVNRELRKGITKYIERYKDKFTKWPASTKYHHAWIGGLLDHTIEVIEIAFDIIDRFQFEVDMDVILASSILHDLGKLKEYKLNEDNTFGYAYPKGTEPDHALFVVMDYVDVVGKNMPYEVRMAVLGHMGKWSKTSVTPISLESKIIHIADYISSRIGEKKGWLER